MIKYNRYFSIVIVLAAVMIIAFSKMHNCDIYLVFAAIMFPLAGFIVVPKMIKH